MKMLLTPKDALVPVPGLEPGSLAAADFESAASTNSAIRATPGSIAMTGGNGQGETRVDSAI